MRASTQTCRAKHWIFTLISKEKVMQPILATLPTLAVSATFCIWNAYRAHLILRNKVKHERVAYLLWVMANEVD